MIRPKVVVSLGNVALQALLEERAAAIGKHHGRVERVRLVENQMALFPMYHPASIIYNPSLREIYLQDIAELSNYLEQQQISRE